MAGYEVGGRQGGLVAGSKAPTEDKTLKTFFRHQWTGRPGVQQSMGSQRVGHN